MTMELLLSIHAHGSYGTAPHPTLLKKTMASGAVPLPGEYVELWADGPQSEVRQHGRFWQSDGNVLVELCGIVVDPDEWEERAIKPGSSWYGRFTSWRTSLQDEDYDTLIARLIEDGGWSVYAWGQNIPSPPMTHP